MNSPYYKKSGLPGLMGTHDKNSPLPFVGAVLAGLGKAALAVGKVGAKVGMAVAKAAPKVAQAVKTGAEAVGQAGKFIGKNVAKGAKNFAGKDGFVSKTVKQGKELVAKGERFAKTSTGKAVIGGLNAGKRAADKQIQEVDNSVYSSGKGLSGGIGGMNFNNKRI